MVLYSFCTAALWVALASPFRVGLVTNGIRDNAMSQAQFVWRSLEERRRAAANREYVNIVLAACLLSVVAATEVLFLYHVAGRDTVNLLAAAEGIPTVE